MIDRIRLTATAKVQLSTLKRKTNIQHYNSICRHALCLSLANKSSPPDEVLNFSGGIEIDWSTFTGGHEQLYLNLLLARSLIDRNGRSDEDIKLTCTSHIHRGLSYLVGMGDGYLAESIPVEL